MIFGKEIRARRLELGLSQPALERLSGVGYRVISSIESGVRFGSYESRLALARALALDEAAMVEGADSHEFAPIGSGEKLRARREELELSIAELARIAGTNEETISKAERGKTRPLLSTWTRLEKALLRYASAIGGSSSVISTRPYVYRYKGKVLAHSFTEGQAYIFVLRRGRADAMGPFHISNTRRFVFLRDEPGQGCLLHVFRHHEGGWLETFTDAQCSDYKISEV